MTNCLKSVRSWLLPAALGVLSMSLPLAVPAQQSETPTSFSGGKVIAADDAKKLLDAKAVFVDTRSALNFGKGHLPGAVLIPYKGSSDDVADFDIGKDQFDLAKLPADKGRPIVMYSHGPTGWKSYKAAVFAVKGGYTNVHYYRGGLDDWKTKSLPTE